jgi:hypothetical protein
MNIYLALITFALAQGPGNRTQTTAVRPTAETTSIVSSTIIPPSSTVASLPVRPTTVIATNSLIGGIVQSTRNSGPGPTIAVDGVVDTGRIALGKEGIIAIVVASCAVLFGILAFIIVRMRAKKNQDETLIDLQQINLSHKAPTPPPQNPAIVSVMPSKAGARFDPATGNFYSTAQGSNPPAVAHYPPSQKSDSSELLYSNKTQPLNSGNYQSGNNSIASKYLSLQSEATQGKNSSYEGSNQAYDYSQYFVDANGRPYTQAEMDEWYRQQGYSQEEIDLWNAHYYSQQQ